MIAHRRGRIVIIDETPRRPIRLAPRRPVGLWALLTLEQKVKALTYTPAPRRLNVR